MFTVSDYAGILLFPGNHYRIFAAKETYAYGAVNAPLLINSVILLKLEVIADVMENGSKKQ